jgi:30S ribosomal protein S31
MGKGDKRTKKGKIFAGSYGKSRPKPKPKNVAPAEGVEKTSKKGK